MACAEREARLDLDRDVVGADQRAVVRAMHEKAPGAHGLNPASALATQSRFSVRPNVAERAVSSSDAAATSARMFSSSGAKPK